MAHSTTGPRMTQLAIDPKDRPIYSRAQLDVYFKRVGLPHEYLQSPLMSDPTLAQTKEVGLPFVTALTRYHTANVPFENLELHYSTHKKITLEMNALFAKFGERGLQHGRGGRCMENNGFFGTVLRSLGFDVRNCAGRVSRGMSPGVAADQLNTYDPWNHMLNLVRFDGELYIVDVGMGAMGPNVPFPLQDGFETVSIAPRRIRLQWRSIPEHAALKEENAQKLWCYDVCYHPTGDATQDKWIRTYCFTETEFLPQDYEMMSWFTSTNPVSFFTSHLMCTKMILDDKGQNIIGDVTLFDDSVRKTLGGNRETVATFQSEQDRIEALKDIFGLDLTQEERQAIPKDVQISQQSNGA